MGDIYKKINRILEIFLDDKNGSKPAKSWEVGTNFYNSLKIFIKKIKENNLIKKENFISIRKVYLCDDNNLGKDCFQMLLNDTKSANITQTTKKNESAAKSTIRQYLQVLAALGIIPEQEAIKKIEDGTTIELTELVHDFIKYDENEILEKFIKMISEAIFSHIAFVKNLGFSLFLCLIDEYGKQNNTNYFEYINNFEFVNKQNNPKLREFRPFRTRNETTIEYIKHLKGEKTAIFGSGKNTYTMLCKEIAENYDFEDVVSSIHQGLVSNSDENDEANKNIFFILDKKIKDNKAIHEKTNSFINVIKIERAKLRKNIINNRVNATLDSNSSKKLYFDISNSITNYTDVSYMDACHIYDVEYIIKDLKKLISANVANPDDFNNETLKDKIGVLINDASDFNNGLLMNKNCHQLFDKRLVWFSRDGKLNYVNEEKENVEKSFGTDYDNIFIAKNVLTEKMKEYLDKRQKFRY